MLIVKNNILSLRQLLENGYEIKIKNHTLTLLGIKGAMIERKNIMFLLNIEMNVPKCLNTCVKDET